MRNMNNGRELIITNGFPKEETSDNIYVAVQKNNSEREVITVFSQEDFLFYKKVCGEKILNKGKRIEYKISSEPGYFQREEITNDIAEKNDAKIRDLFTFESRQSGFSKNLETQI